MTKDEITAWALASGWQIIDGSPCLTKPSAPHPAIVRLTFKATVAVLEIKKPAGKWDLGIWRNLAGIWREFGGIWGIWNLEFGIWNLEFGIWNLQGAGPATGG